MNSINVYIDGACINNGSKDAKAGYAVYFGDKDDHRNESGQVEGKQSNNTGELTAFIRCLQILQPDIQQKREINVYTDSEYVMKCATSYGGKAKDTAPNIELVREAYALFKTAGPTVKLHHIRAHTNKDDIHSLGNAEVDRMAGAAIGIDPDAERKASVIKLDWISFGTKDAAKALGAKWNVKGKFWYVESDENLEKLKELKEQDNGVKTAYQSVQLENRKYVKIPYAEKEKAKAKGAKWDPEKKSWYYIIKDN